jgi:hypothetical protein
MDRLAPSFGPTTDGHFGFVTYVDADHQGKSKFVFFLSAFDNNVPYSRWLQLCTTYLNVRAFQGEINKLGGQEQKDNE